MIVKLWFEINFNLKLILKFVFLKGLRLLLNNLRLRNLIGVKCLVGIWI